MTTEQNLTEALALIGIRHEPSTAPSKRDWFNAAGEKLGTYDAQEGWEKLRSIVNSIDRAA